MTDSPVPTLVHTDEGVLAFQEYFVRRKCEPVVKGFSFEGVELSQPAPGVMEALVSSGAVIVCPSNPFISIGPILAVPGIREAMRQAEATVVAVSPVVGGQAIKGPTAAMLAQLGHDVSAAGVAAMYADILDAFVLDTRDEALRSRVSDLGLAVRTAETIMNSAQARVDLARAVMEMVP
jgi:LPPG:FO 2-phospho-L-lactate transferase